MADPKTFYLQLPSEPRPEPIELNAQAHSAHQWLVANRSRARGSDAAAVLDTIVVHATGGHASGHAIDTWRRKRASAHWIIPGIAEAEHGRYVWATVPEHLAAFHVRDLIAVEDTILGPGPNVNNRSLGIEIVNTQEIENYRQGYSAWQIEMAAQIVRYAWALYAGLRHIVSHAKLDPQRRSDPGRQFPWDEFGAQVLQL